MQLVKQQMSGDISSRYLFRLRFPAIPNTPSTPRASSQPHSCLPLRCAAVPVSGGGADAAVQPTCAVGEWLCPCWLDCLETSVCRCDWLHHQCQHRGTGQPWSASHSALVANPCLHTLRVHASPHPWFRCALTMTPYKHLQFSAPTFEGRQGIAKALWRCCEPDTLAMLILVHVLVALRLMATQQVRRASLLSLG